MLSIIIPTRNRSDIILNTLPSYIEQEYVKEIIIVDDHSSDNTKETIQHYVEKYPRLIKYYRNTKHYGAAYSRNVGVDNTKYDYVLWGEDDLILGKNYTKILFEYFTSHKNIDIIAGKIIYLLQDEDIVTARIRITQFKNSNEYLNKKILELNSNYTTDHPITAPFLHAIVLTKTELLKKYRFDINYRGNGYREETDFQINVLRQNGKIIHYPDVFCFHLNSANIAGGGQSDRSWINYEYWTIKNNNYFIDKHFDVLKKQVGLPYSKRNMKYFFIVNRYHHYILPRIKKMLSF